jgi:uncharacterized membrane protein YoaK (UPF0700 family)
MGEFLGWSLTGRAATVRGVAEENTGSRNAPAPIVVGWAAWLLAAVGGWVDAVGFVMLGHLFTANMSGNSVQFAAYFGVKSFGSAWPCLLAIPVFMTGVFLGTLALAWSRVARPERRVYAVEAVLLVILAGELWVKVGQGEAGDPWSARVAEVCALLAMGLQNATTRRVGSVNINTTFITGLLVVCGQMAARTVVAWRAGDPVAAGAAAVESSRAGRLWLTYAMGALAGAAGVVWVGPGTLLVPVAALVAVVVAATDT